MILRDNSRVDVDDPLPERRASPSRELQVSSRGFFLIKEEPQAASTRTILTERGLLQMQMRLVRALEEASACRLCYRASVLARLCRYIKRENNGTCIT